MKTFAATIVSALAQISETNRRVTTEFDGIQFIATGTAFDFQVNADLSKYYWSGTSLCAITVRSASAYLDTEIGNMVLSVEVDSSPRGTHSHLSELESIEAIRVTSKASQHLADMWEEIHINRDYKIEIEKIFKHLESVDENLRKMWDAKKEAKPAA